MNFEMNLCQLCKRKCSVGEKKACLSAPKLNLGSGLMLRKDFINFDFRELTFKDLRTDIIGDIKDLTKIFQPKTFSTIFCAHVIEHFYLTDAIQVLKDCHIILKSKGTLVIEAPDISSLISRFNKGVTDIDHLIVELYGEDSFREKWGNEWMHRWGWTGKKLGSAMKKVGFKIQYMGRGHSHSHPDRDFKVIGIK